MQARESPTFDRSETRRIYELVERNGIVSRDALEDRIDLDSDRFSRELATLKWDGYLAERNGTLRVDLDGGSEEKYRVNGVEYTIRPAQPEDATAIREAVRRVVEEDTYVVAERIAEQLDHEDTLIRHNNFESRHFFVATVHYDVVGWAHIDIPRADPLRHTAELTIGVLDDYRRRGIGSHLMQRVLNWAGMNDVHKLYQSVPETNEAAAAFLDDQGWRTEAMRRDHYRIDGEFVTELMMACQLEIIRSRRE